MGNRQSNFIMGRAFDFLSRAQRDWYMRQEGEAGKRKLKCSELKYRK